MRVGRVVVAELHLLRQLAVRAVAAVGAQVLHHAKSDDARGVPCQLALGQRGREVEQHTADEETDAVDRVDVQVGRDLLHGNRLALVAVAHLSPALVVDVVHRRRGHVRHLAAAPAQATGQVHILQPGQLFVESVMVPRLAKDRAVGVVAEEAVLRDQAVLGEVLGKQLRLAELGRLGADLASVDVLRVAVEQRLRQLGQPPLRRGNAVATDERQDVAAGKRTADVERAAERELLFADRGHPTVEVGRDRQGVVGRSGVDDDHLDLEVIGLLGRDRVQQPTQVPPLVVGADDDAGDAGTSG